MNLSKLVPAIALIATLAGCRDKINERGSTQNQDDLDDSSEFCRENNEELEDAKFGFELDMRHIGRAGSSWRNCERARLQYSRIRQETLKKIGSCIGNSREGDELRKSVKNFLKRREAAGCFPIEDPEFK